MEKKLFFNDICILYTLERKRVKNINLRIRSDGSIYVSANRLVPLSIIENFIRSKADFILNASKKQAESSFAPKTQYFTQNELFDYVESFCKKIYPYYNSLGINYPVIKFRKMVSRWGSCQPHSGILTFNKNLIYAPPRCVEYVVLHEFTHFIVPNHSKEFYFELSKVLPEHMQLKKELNTISLRNTR